MKRIASAAAALALAVLAASAQDAQAIARAARDRIRADTVSTRARMVITDKSGAQTERLVDQYSATVDGADATMIVFQKPASVAGTRFLTIQAPGKPEDRWIFLPSLGKVRRISAGEGSGSFMGTDFSYDDVSLMDRDVDLDTFTLAREETLDGKACWVLEARPKDPGYQYSRMLLWIGKADSISWKIEMYDRRDAPVKVLTIDKVQDIQGRLSPVQTTVRSVQAGTSTVLFVDILKYDDKIPPTVFTVRFLETGRP
ncbi:MAG TPA: outer membrane lipoprotein-sorting protein [Spirochaetia bacterium]|nr:outer membrane lipoprotein-sorting protein [Spirochaetales bacterium]HRY80947.1 outer membrane lipoprotein-sorting protein [Spirochaetia bacterium]HRZ90519.1 outer membrane lipoprotein-sorting protein [Spirochaetia bacterium]